MITSMIDDPGDHVAFDRKKIATLAEVLRRSAQGAAATRTLA